MLLQILNFFPIHYITIFTFLIAAVLGVATAVVHAQYQHIVKTNNTMGKKTKRKSRNGLLITFCIFAFISLLSFVFQKRLSSSKSLTSSSVNLTSPKIVYSIDDINTILQSLEMNGGLENGYTQDGNFDLVNDKNQMIPVSVVRACCEEGKTEPSVSLIYSPPNNDYDFALVQNSNTHDQRLNKNLRFITFNKNGKWIKAVLVSEQDNKGIFKPYLEKKIREKDRLGSYKDYLYTYDNILQETYYSNLDRETLYKNLLAQKS